MQTITVNTKLVKSEILHCIPARTEFTSLSVEDL